MLPLLFCLAVLLPAAAQTATERFADAILAEVELHTVTASDVALARALGLFGLEPSNRPIRTEDLQRFLDALLIVNEASRLNIQASEDELSQVRQAAASLFGGRRKLEAWLEDTGIDAAWTEKLFKQEADRNHFVEQRFGKFVFVSEEQISDALGPGAHGAKEREDKRAVLIQKRAKSELEQWLEEQRQQTQINYLMEKGASVPMPFALPFGAASFLTEPDSARGIQLSDL